MTAPDARPDERGQRVRDETLRWLCDGSNLLALDLRDARAALLRQEAENERLKTALATALKNRAKPHSPFLLVSRMLEEAARDDSRPRATRSGGGRAPGAALGAAIMRQTLQSIRVMQQLAAQQTYGRQLMKKVGLSSGTLYPMLQRMEEAGLAVGVWEEGKPQQLGRPLTRFWRLTAAGQAELARVQELLK